VTNETDVRVPSVHEPIDKLRRERDGKFTGHSDGEDVLQRWLAGCPAETYFIIDQPGLRVDDFQQLVKDGILKWNYLRTFFERAATVGSFPRLDGPIDVDWLARRISKQRVAKTLLADPDDLIEEYTDTERRVIRLNLEPLPQDSVERALQLQTNDDNLCV
jgi:hypothetical protein